MKMEKKLRDLILWKRYMIDILIISHDLKSSDLRNIPNNIKVHRCRYNLNFYEKIQIAQVLV